MASEGWHVKLLSVSSLHLDAKNPRLGREIAARAPREIIQYLFDHDKALEVAHSIATRGYFPNEPLLAVKEDEKLIVVEGNRRLAALKALRESGLIEGAHQRQVERLAKLVANPEDIAKVPVVLAPTRRATDRLIAGRHIGTPVLAWQAENRASFILDKLAEGYTNAQLQDQLGFSLSDIQAARQTRAIADMARSLDLPDDVKAKLENPRAKLFSTLERVFDSTVGREYLMVEPDPDHGIRGTTTGGEFLRGFTRLVTDIALKRKSSRNLNTKDNIRAYFESWDAAERPSKKRGSFIPAELIRDHSVASPAQSTSLPAAPKRNKNVSSTVVPKAFKVRLGDERLVEIRSELVKLKREDFPNAGAVLLRVFLELAMVDFLRRRNLLSGLIQTIQNKQHGRPLPFGTPTLKQLAPEIIRIAKAELSVADALKVEKALKYDSAAPFSISELHGFIHGPDLPNARDIQQFWNRTEPLFRLMLEYDPKAKTT